MAETELDGGYRSFAINFIDRRNLSKHWQLFTQAGYEKYSSDISDSPIARNDYEAEIGLSAIYVF